MFNFIDLNFRIFLYCYYIILLRHTESVEKGKVGIARKGRAKEGARHDESNFRGAANWQSDDK